MMRLKNIVTEPHSICLTLMAGGVVILVAGLAAL
jgi:hypothetical protein